MYNMQSIIFKLHTNTIIIYIPIVEVGLYNFNDLRKSGLTDIAVLLVKQTVG